MGMIRFPEHHILLIDRDKKMKKTIATAFFTGLLILAPWIFTGSYDKEFEWSKNLDIYQSLLRELDLYYVDEIDPGKMVRTGIDQSMKTLDPYTVYIPESQIEDLQLMTTGEYGGIGATVGQDREKIYISDPYEGTPAQKAGLRAGDVILKIDDRPVAGKTISEISDLMKGEVGSDVRMTVERPFANRQLTVAMKREKIRFDNVPYFKKLGNGCGYIRLTGFTEGAGREVKSALLDLKQQGATRVIIDLRGNPGGLLLEAVEIMNIFVPKGQEVVSTKGKARQWDAVYNCRYEPVDTLIPVAVLVNSSSASASEIVAGAMQDLDRGVVIGQRTFGKGLVQTTRDLSYNAKLKLTTAKYYIPSGRCIQALDYTNRRPDGSVGQIPDSLTTAFKTRAGRPVRDGGGIVPDIKVDPLTLSGMTTSLIYQRKLFNYATRFRNSNDSIEPAAAFKLAADVYDDFGKYLKSEKFTYRTAREDAIKELVESVKSEKYYEQSKDLIGQLSETLKHDLDNDLELFRPEVEPLLAEEIIGRYFYQKGRIEFMTREDQTIREAGRILADPSEYARILMKK
jgi:carboxyl-terminal processing protease